MLKKLILPFRDIKVWIYVGVVLLISIIVGIVKQPFRFGFLNSLGILTAILFFVGTFRQAWLKGDFSSLEFQRSKDLDPTYADYRKRILAYRSKHFLMVEMMGLEPIRPFRQRILSPLRLPIPPHLHGGSCRSRTGARRVAVCCLTTWLRNQAL